VDELSEGAGASLSEIELVYRARFSEFARVAAAITGEQSNAADVVQDAFAVLIRKRASFVRRGPLEGWIWRTVVNTALNRRAGSRRRERQPRRGSDLRARNGHEPATPALTSLRADLAGLPERQRLVVFLRYYADLDYSTIGATLGISSGTVASTLSSAHKTLRRALKQEALR
jgi:RNA polymerase sigma factor (sigma-70 family)